MKNTDFHIPFLHSLVIIATFTLVSMIIARFYIYEHYKTQYQTPSFTDQKFDNTISSSK